MKDPVCGMEVDLSKPKAESRYQGRDYRFCSAECKKKFDENPGEYTEPQADAQSIMTQHPACVTPQTSLREAAQLMVANDCGAIPVIEENSGNKIIGIITDRDIVCRAVAQGKNPLDLNVEACMSRPVVTAGPDASLGECARLMEDNQIRRIPIVDSQGLCRGIVTQAHVARHANARDVGEIVKGVSRKTESASRVPAGV